MNPALQALLDDFAQRHAELRFATDDQGQLVLLFDEQRIVNFVDEPGSGLVWAFAMLGRLPSRHGGVSQAEYGDKWVSHTREDEGFEFSISSNVASGVIALAAKAALSSLDAVAFDRWLSAFLERVDATSGVLNP